MTRIMFVDDEQNVLNALSRSLRQQPWEIVTHTDPYEALRQLELQEFDVVVSDYRMPGINGVQFLEYCRFRQQRAVRVILSAYTEKNGMLDAINTANIYRFLIKPWDEAELVTMLKQAIETCQLQQERAELLELVEQQRTRLKEQQLAIDSFAREHPALANVIRDADNRILIDQV